MNSEKKNDLKKNHFSAFNSPLMIDVEIVAQNVLLQLIEIQRDSKSKSKYIHGGFQIS